MKPLHRDASLMHQPLRQVQQLLEDKNWMSAEAVLEELEQSHSIEQGSPLYGEWCILKAQVALAARTPGREVTNTSAPDTPKVSAAGTAAPTANPVAATRQRDSSRRLRLLLKTARATPNPLPNRNPPQSSGGSRHRDLDGKRP